MAPSRRTGDSSGRSLSEQPPSKSTTPTHNRQSVAAHPERKVDVMPTGLLDSSSLLPEYPQQQKPESDAVNNKRLHADTLDKSDEIVNTDIGAGSRQYHAGHQSQPLDLLGRLYQPEDF